MSGERVTYDDSGNLDEIVVDGAAHLEHTQGTGGSRSGGARSSMTPEAALLELLARVGARDGAPALFSDHELSAWPGAAVAAMKSQGLLKKASPARSAICPGCERECAMPVHVISNKGHKTDAFIVCDRRSDINRVAVPLSLLEQWQASGDSIAAVLTHLLKLPAGSPARSR